MPDSAHLEPLEVGTDAAGARFTWTRADPHIASLGRLELDVWRGDEDEAAHVDLGSDDALSLAQWINEALDRD